MSDRAQNRAKVAFLNMIGVLLPIIGTILVVMDSRSPYATSVEQGLDLLLMSLLLTALALNLVFFIVHIVQMIDEMHAPEDEYDAEIEEARRQLEADGLEFDASDEIIRSSLDDELYLCLGDDLAAAVDLKLVKNGEGRWQMFIDGHEDTPVPVSHVAGLRTRVRELDAEIIGEIKRLTPETA